MFEERLDNNDDHDKKWT